MHDRWCMMYDCYFATCCILINQIQIYSDIWCMISYISYHIYCYFATCCILIFRFRYIQIYDVWYHIYLIIYTATLLHAASWYSDNSDMHHTCMMYDISYSDIYIIYFIYVWWCIICIYCFMLHLMHLHLGGII